MSVSIFASSEGDISTLEFKGHFNFGLPQYPELFPKEVVDGYALHDERASEKIEGVWLQRICLKACDIESKKQVFTFYIFPSLSITNTNSITNHRLWLYSLYFSTKHPHQTQ